MSIRERAGPPRGPSRALLRLPDRVFGDAGAADVRMCEVVRWCCAA
ncbi:hypothetical protein GCM10023237_39500 [Streptomyces coeruleoprunus]